MTEQHIGKPVLEVEEQISRQLAESAISQVDLNLDTTKSVVALIVEEMFSSKGARLTNPPLVELEFRPEAILMFKVQVEIDRPVSANIQFSGFLVNGQTKPHLLNNRFHLNIEAGTIANLALHTKNIRQEIGFLLNNLPEAILLTLPKRLDRIGNRQRITSVSLLIGDNFVSATIC